MEWLKKNMTLVISGLVALALVGFAGYYLYGQIQKNARVTTALTTEKQRYEGLAKKNPGLGTDVVDNVRAAEARLMQLAAVENKIESLYAPAKTISADEQAFKLELGNVVSRLKREGEKVGMTLTNDFMLSFTAQSESFLFASNSLETLVVQLADLKEISDIILNAGVNSIEQVRRVKVSEDDSGPTAVAGEYLSEDYLIVTNEITGAVIYPYEVTVRTFSDGLGRLLKGFAESDYPVVLKTLEIEQTETKGLNVPGLTPAPSPGTARYGAQSRYSTGGATSAGAGTRSGDSRRSSGGTERYGGSRNRATTDARRGGAQSGGVATQAEIDRILQSRGLSPQTSRVRTEPIVAFSETPLEVVLGIEVIHFPASETTETASQ